ncbi:hypothetical protein GCM10010406_19790 [Streptomyces thermolineatus]|uniref:Transposase n=1 Tax=Streptomyces thermolineatus TaxID=44033 RepID=A0ABP5YLU4_9ACTN
MRKRGADSMITARVCHVRSAVVRADHRTAGTRERPKGSLGGSNAHHTYEDGPLRPPGSALVPEDRPERLAEVLTDFLLRTGAEPARCTG